MNTLGSNKSSVAILQRTVNFVWPYVGGKRGLVLLAVTIVAAGMSMNWGWLVAVGVAPILISLLPCVIMCSVGMCCMKKGKDKSSSTKQDDQE